MLDFKHYLKSSLELNQGSPLISYAQLTHGSPVRRLIRLDLSYRLSPLTKGQVDQTTNLFRFRRTQSPPCLNEVWKPQTEVQLTDCPELQFKAVFYQELTDLTDIPSTTVQLREPGCMIEMVNLYLTITF